MKHKKVMATLATTIAVLFVLNFFFHIWNWQYRNRGKRSPGTTTGCVEPEQRYWI